VTTDQAAGSADVRVRFRSCSSRPVNHHAGRWEALNGYSGWRLHNPRIRLTGRVGFLLNPRTVCRERACGQERQGRAMCTHDGRV